MPTRRQYSGNAVQTTTTGTLSAGGTTVSINSNSGWPSTAAVPFFVVISPGKAIEEKCSATISGTTLTLTRAQDGTSAQSHPAGSQIYPVFTATDADEANRLASAMTTRGDLVTLDSGPNPTRLAVGAANTVLKSNGTDPSYGLIVTANITDANVTEGKLASNAVTAAKIASNAVETAKINNAAVTAAKLGTASAGTTGQFLIADTGESGGLKWRDNLLDSQTFSSSTTYTVPANAGRIVVECIAAGGGGGGGARNTSTSQAGGGGGGAGGAWERVELAASEVGGAGASVTVTIGAGGTGGAGRTGSTGVGTAGGVGGISRFGTVYFAGGRRGAAGSTSTTGTGAVGYLLQGVISTTGFGAGGDGSGATTGIAGVTSFRGGAGGGGGGGRTSTNRAGGAGGSFQSSPSISDGDTWSIQGGGGGAAGTAGGGNGTAGGTSQGGGGGGSNNAAAGGTGGAGGAPGGGGGGGGGANGDADGGTGGTGGNAQIKIWVYA